MLKAARRPARRLDLADRGYRDVLQLTERTRVMPLAIAGTGFGLIGILVIILLVLMILYFVRRV